MPVPVTRPTLLLIVCGFALLVAPGAGCSTTTPRPTADPAVGDQPDTPPPPVEAADEPPPRRRPGRSAPAPRLSSDAKAILKVHNAARKAVGVGPLKWSPRLARFAQAWANRLAHKGALQHRPHAGPWKQKYGENLAMAGGSAYPTDYGRKGSLQWLSEKRRYKHGNRSLAGVGHYTQMVWRKTTHIGCGLARYKSGMWKNVILVCNYDPAGNMMGQKPY